MQREIRYPAICARCAKRPALTWQKVTSQRTQFQIVRTKITTYTLYVPVCEQCRQFLSDVIFTLTALSVVLIVIGAVAAMVFMADRSTTRELLVWTLFGGLGGVIVAAAINGFCAILFNMQYVQYKGQYFSFSNSTYRTQFARLNPQLVNFSVDRTMPPPPIFGPDAWKRFAKELVIELKAGKPIKEVRQRLQNAKLPDEQTRQISEVLDRFDPS